MNENNKLTKPESEPKELYVGVKEINFCKFDEDGNEVLNKDGTVKEFYLTYKADKHLSYFFEGLSEEDVEESEGPYLKTNENPTFTVDEARLIQLCIEFANNDDELLDRFKYTLYEDGFDGKIKQGYRLPDNILGSIWDKLNLILRPTVKEKITQEQVEFWLGSDNTVEEAVEILTDIANGEYEPKILSEEILDIQEQS